MMFRVVGFVGVFAVLGFAFQDDGARPSARGGMKVTAPVSASRFLWTPDAANGLSVAIEEGSAADFTVAPVIADRDRVTWTGKVAYVDPESGSDLPIELSVRFSMTAPGRAVGGEHPGVLVLENEETSAALSFEVESPCGSGRWIALDELRVRPERGGRVQSGVDLRLLPTTLAPALAIDERASAPVLAVERVGDRDLLQIRGARPFGAAILFVAGPAERPLTTPFGEIFVDPETVSVVATVAADGDGICVSEFAGGLSAESPRKTTAVTALVVIDDLGGADWRFTNAVSLTIR